MKTVAIINDFCGLEHVASRFLDRIRRETGADYLVTVMSGDFTHSGTPAEKDKYNRAKFAVAAGTDLVVELPVYSTLMTLDGMAFAAAAMLEKLACIDELVLPCTANNIDRMNDLALYLFMEPVEYQKRFKYYRAQGYSIHNAQTMALKDMKPGDGVDVSLFVNMFALEMAKALKKMYSSIKVRFLNISDDEELMRCFVDRCEIPTEQDRALGELLQKMVVQMDRAAAKRYLNNIYGGFESYSEELIRIMTDSELISCNGMGSADMKNRIKIESEDDEAKNEYKTPSPSFMWVAERMGSRRKSAEELRGFFIRALMNFRGMDNSICGLYTYVLYIRVLGWKRESDALLELLKKKAWPPILIEETVDNAAENVKSLADECKEQIAGFDMKAHELYLKIVNKC